MGDHDFRHLRQQDRHPVAARDPVRAQHIGQAIGLLLQPAERNVVVPPVGMDMDDGQPPRIARRPAVADIDPDIVVAGNLPAELGIKTVVIADVRQHCAFLAGAKASQRRCRRPALFRQLERAGAAMISVQNTLYLEFGA